MIYLDNSATTKPCPQAVEAITAALTENWANPSALYNFGIDTAKALRTARHFGLDTSLLEPMATATMQEATPRPQATPLSIEKARQAFGYAPHTLEEGLRELAEA